MPDVKMVQPNNQRQVSCEERHAHLLQPGHDTVLMETVPAGQLHHLAACLVLFAAHLRQLNLAFSRCSLHGLMRFQHWGRMWGMAGRQRRQHAAAWVDNHRSSWCQPSRANPPCIRPPPCRQRAPTRSRRCRRRTPRCERRSPPPKQTAPYKTGKEVERTGKEVRLCQAQVGLPTRAGAPAGATCEKRANERTSEHACMH